MAIIAAVTDAAESSPRGHKPTFSGLRRALGVSCESSEASSLAAPRSRATPQRREPPLAFSKQPSYLKRQKEQQRLARAAEKREARRARKHSKESQGDQQESLDGTLDGPDGEAATTESETETEEQGASEE